MDKNRLQRRRFHVRKRISGSVARPRLAVRRTAKHIYALLVADDQRKVLTTVSSLSKELAPAAGNKSARAKLVGKLLADKAKGLGVTQVVFDRGGFRYHGRVKAVAEGAREGGLRF
jgi:large subunit ribosomal protein L18